jgi:hypothetical protein
MVFPTSASNAPQYCLSRLKELGLEGYRMELPIITNVIFSMRSSIVVYDSGLKGLECPLVSLMLRLLDIRLVPTYNQSVPCNWFESLDTGFELQAL